jgi:hypothetical protein
MTCDDVFRSLMPFKGNQRGGTERWMSQFGKRLCQRRRLLAGRRGGRLSTIDTLKTLERIESDRCTALGCFNWHHELTGVLACHHTPRLAGDIDCIVGLSSDGAATRPARASVRLLL